MNTNNIISLISTIREKANKHIIKEMAKRNINGLATSHGDILSILFKQEEVSMKDIADRIERDKSTVTALVDKLVSYGYVYKKKDALDNRVVLVTLTEEGKKLRTHFNEISSSLMSVAFKGISEDERQILAKTLLRIKDNF